MPARIERCERASCSRARGGATPMADGPAVRAVPAVCSANRSRCCACRRGGIAPPGWALRAALFVAYAVVGALLLARRGAAGRAAGAGAWRRRRSRCSSSCRGSTSPFCRASAALRSLLGNVAAVRADRAAGAAAGAAAPRRRRRRRGRLLAWSVNLWPMLGGASARTGGARDRAAARRRAVQRRGGADRHAARRSPRRLRLRAADQPATSTRWRATACSSSAPRRRRRGPSRRSPR